MKNNHAVSEIIGSVLLIILVITLAAVVTSLFFGFVNLTTKPALIAVDMAKTTSSGKEVISVFSRGGDTGYLNAPAESSYPIGIYVNDTTIGSYRIQPPSGVNAFSPGTMLLVFYNSSTGYAITSNTTVLASADPSLPGSLTSVRLVDERSKFLIAKWDGSTGGAQALSVISITPNSGFNTLSIPITDLIGTGFQVGATVRLNRTLIPDIPATSVNVASSTKISCTFNLNGAATGPYNIVVKNTNGQSAMLAGGFTIIPALPAPTVTSINATTGYRGWPVTEIITGTNFVSGSTSKLTRAGSADIPARICTFVSSTQLICTYDLLGQGASPANYNVSVTNPDGRTGMRANYFILSSPAPTITSSAPAAGLQAATVPITNIQGTYFQPDATVVYSQGTTSIPLTSVNVISRTQIAGTLLSPSNAPTGAYSVTVTNTDGKTITRASTFTVNSNAPTVTSINATTGYRGWPVTEIITGTNFVSGATSKLTRAGSADIPASMCTFVSSTQLICTYDLLGQGASPANYNVSVTNPDGKSGMRANYFILSSPAPTISSSTPATGVMGNSVIITNLAGTYFQPGAAVVYSQGTTSIPLTSVNVISRTQITGTLLIPSNAPTGAYSVTVTNTDGKTITRASTFTVYANPPPSVTGITPGSGVRVVAVPVVVTGMNIQVGARVRLYNGTTAVYLAPVGTVTPPNQISTTFTVPLSVQPGTMNVRITNIDGQFGTLTGGYILLP